jgi:hypothetical protein
MEHQDVLVDVAGCGRYERAALWLRQSPSAAFLHAGAELRG